MDSHTEVISQLPSSKNEDVLKESVGFNAPEPTPSKTGLPIPGMQYESLMDAYDQCEEELKIPLQNIPFICNPQKYEDLLRSFKSILNKSKDI